MAAPAIGLRPRWQPNLSAKVDWSHPLAEKLMSALIVTAGVCVDVAGGIQLAKNSTPTHGRNGWGPGLVNAGANQGMVATVGTTHPMCLQPPLSIMWVGSRVGTPDAFSSMLGVVQNNSDSSPYECYTIGFDNSSVVRFATNYGGAPYFAVGATLTVGPHVLVGVRTVSTMELWMDGLYVAGHTPGATITYAATSHFGINVNSGTSRSTNCTTNFGAVWNRQLSAGEIAELTGDPFCFLRR